MHDLATIWSQHNNNQEHWLHLAKLKDTRCFMYSLYPLLNYEVSCIKSFFKKTNKLCKAMPSDKVICQQVEKSLTKLLLPVISQIMTLEFCDALEGGRIPEDHSMDKLTKFIRVLSDFNVMKDIFDKYPVAKIQITSLLTQNYHVHKRMFTRLSSDIDRIESGFKVCFSKDKVTSWSVGGDRHCNGEGTTIIVFTSKNSKKTWSLVYKPRNLNAEKAFAKFISWFNKFAVYEHRVPQTIAFDNYGWQFFLNNLDCDSLSEVSNYYERMGSLLAIFYMIKGSDFHHENIIASGQYPIPIDCECLFTPFEFIQRGSDYPQVTDSLVLPININYEGNTTSVSALQGSHNEMTVPMLAWNGKFFAQKKVTRIDSDIHINSIPCVKGKKIYCLDYESEVKKGFNNTLSVFSSHKEKLLLEGLPLFLQTKCRYVPRATQFYMDIIVRGYHPTLMVAPEKRKRWIVRQLKQIKQLRCFSEFDEQDLMVHNVPFYYIYCDDNVVYHHSGNVVTKTSECVFNLVKSNLDLLLASKTIKVQNQLISNSFIALKVSLQQQEQEKNSKKLSNKKIIKKLPMTTKMGKSLDKDKMINACRLVLDNLVSMAAHHRSEIKWPGLNLEVFDDDNASFNPGFIGYSLYDGNIGLALVLSYAHKILGDKSYGELANKTLKPLAKISAKSVGSDLLFNSFCKNIGAYSGLGGLIYVLSKVKDDLNITGAQKTIDKCLKICRKLIVKDDSLDIIGGAAGLLAVLNNVGLDKELQVLCKQHLLTSIPDPYYGIKAKNADGKTLPKVSLVGMSHGVTGYYWSLLRAFPHDPKVLSWCKRALEYEQSKYLEKDANWRDLRESNKKTQAFKESKKDTMQTMSAWCHGAPGIGLAKIDLRSQHLDFTTGLSQAIATTAKDNYAVSNLSLCHGLLGNAELLFMAHQQGIIADHYKDLVHLVNQSVAQINAGKAIFASDGHCGYHFPNLMLGAAGSAYQLLRFSFPQEVPSLLLLK